MAARTKAAITIEARKIVAPFHVSIEGSENPGDLGADVPRSLTITTTVIVLLLLILEVLLNIRQGETA